MAGAGRNELGPGWLASFAIVFLLIVAGFGVGLIAGAAFEDPGLLLSHLTGRSEDVPLGERPELQQPEALRPSPAPTAPDAAPAPARLPSSTPPPAPSEGFVVQVGAFEREAPALDLLRELEALALPVYLARKSDRARFKVRVGPFATRDEANQIAQRLKREQLLPTWVLKREP